MANPLVKFTVEDRVYEFDFSNVPEILEGDTLTGTPTVVATPSDLTVGSATISGSTVLVDLSGGTAGIYYDVACTVSTLGGSVLAWSGQLQVIAQ